LRSILLIVLGFDRNVFVDFKPSEFKTNHHSSKSETFKYLLLFYLRKILVPFEYIKDAFTVATAST
jgi:hypothetical protein